VSISTVSRSDDCWQPHEIEGEDESLFDSLLIVDGYHGIYVPQIFCERFEKTDKVSQEGWDICLSGPYVEFEIDRHFGRRPQEHYWDSWEIILNEWGGEETDQAGNRYQTGIYQDGDLFQTRRLIEAE